MEISWAHIYMCIEREPERERERDREREFCL